ncbi:MAG: hypothetical protein BHV77_13385 [Bacteroides sp. 43_108]|nr:MAG: hypothetical protein BHV77_13385 [Bacteroides sp. 43_108]
MCDVPALRFPEFSGEWKKLRLSDFATKITKKNKGNIVKNVLCNSANLGLVPQGNYFDREIANTENTDGYYVICNGDFVYNPRKSTAAPFGPVNIYEGEDAGIISPLYLCFSVHNIFPKFLYYRFKSSAWHSYVYSHGDSGVRFDRVSIKDDVFFDMPIYKPAQDEQIKIATLLQLIDDRISTQNKIIEKLETLIKGIVELAFSHAATSNTLGCYITQISQRNKIGKNLPVLSVSNKHGFVEQSEQFEDRIIASDDTSNYKIVSINDFAFNPARINVGSIARLKDKECGIVSPMYICFRTSKDILPEYLELFFKTVMFSFEVKKRLEGSVRLCLSYESLCEIVIPVISIREQHSLVKMVTAFYSKLCVEKIFLRSCQSQRQYLLSQMFI